MPDWVEKLVPMLGTAAMCIGYMSTITKPMKTKLDEMVAKEVEKEKEEQRWQKIERWTENQQEDLDKQNNGLVIIASAVEALLDHAIVKQNGNGKCHKAQEEVEGFIREKSLHKKSYK